MEDQLMQLTAADLKGFWIGAAASILAAAVVGALVYVFRSALNNFKQQNAKERIRSEAFNSALDKASPFAPFAFGIVQGRALRLFFIAVIIAYVGDVLSIFFPFNLVLYAIALIYLVGALRWMNKLEKKALDMIEGFGTRNEKDK